MKTLDYRYIEPETLHIKEVSRTLGSLYERGFTTYSDCRGEEFLRLSIANDINMKYGCSIDYESNIIITPGARAGINYLLTELCSNTSTTAIYNPTWGYIKEKIVSLKSNYYEVNTLKHGTKDSIVNSLMQRQVDYIFIVHPNNPCGTTLNKGEMKKLVDYCIDKNIILIVDESYIEFMFNNDSASFLCYYNKNMIVVNSLSKKYGLTGWRIGYMIADKSIIYRITLKQHDYICNVPSILQQAVASNYLAYEVELKKQKKKYLFRKNILMNTLNQSPYFNPIEPDGGLFVLSEIVSKNSIKEDVLKKIINKRILCSLVDDKSSDDIYIRFSLCGDDKDFEMLIERISSIY